MTIPTPTSKLPQLPSGVPDAGVLAQLANDFFALLPGQILPQTLPEPPSVDTLALNRGVPQLAPVAGLVPSELPLPHSSSFATPPALGVPQAYAANLPQVDLPTRTVPTTPHYFLGESSSYGGGDLDQLAGLANGGDDRVSAQSFGLPGSEALAQVLAEITRPQVDSYTPAQTGGNSGFYFLEHQLPTTHAVANQAQPLSRPSIDVLGVRRDFPILAERVNGKPLIWLDNAATTHKPQAVIDRLAYFYAHENSNIHRAAHELAARATDAYEAARQKSARFLGAKSADEIVFVRGATEAINLVAQTFGRQFIGADDEIIISHLEHHANIVPWQQLVAETGAKLRVIPVDDQGQLLLEEYAKLLNGRTRLVSVTQVSNALGTVTPVHDIVRLAHAVGARVLIDGAQAVSHLKVDVQSLDADFYVFSGHKVFAPTGIGVLYGKAELLNQLQPWQGGGNMIADVTFDKTVYQAAPSRFEAGTGNIADAVGLGAAIDYLERIGLDNVARYEHDLLVYATHGLQSVPGLRLIGTAQDKASVLSFVLAGYQTEEVGRELNHEGIAVRSGHHCAQPILRRFGLEATVRPSLAFYNTCEEIDTLVSVLHRLARARR